MPLFIDIHDIAGGVAMDDVAKAHLAAADVHRQAHGLVADHIYRVRPLTHRNPDDRRP
jgi:hypothetical protein